MTYAIANHNSSNLNSEVTRWVSGGYTITKVTNLKYVPAGTHERLGIGQYCDVYHTSIGTWHVTLDDAIATCQESIS
jgi:hypothetical protein